ncbi:hypothetical protein AKJ16_DCAP01323, partial [Drosera capensis]
REYSKIGLVYIGDLQAEYSSRRTQPVSDSTVIIKTALLPWFPRETN